MTVAASCYPHLAVGISEVPDGDELEADASVHGSASGLQASSNTTVCSVSGDASVVLPAAAVVLDVTVHAQAITQLK